ncbi:hypothetical protein ZWY2020_057314 [Hordeum vulgare]|nr:hypothetical protein ZWY2020_057314 [Hordeum vulgare]
MGSKARKGKGARVAACGPGEAGASSATSWPALLEISWLRQVGPTHDVATLPAPPRENIFPSLLHPTFLLLLRLRFLLLRLPRQHVRAPAASSLSRAARRSVSSRLASFLWVSFLGPRCLAGRLRSPRGRVFFRFFLGDPGERRFCPSLRRRPPASVPAFAVRRLPSASFNLGDGDAEIRTSAGERLMASMALAEERDALDSSRLPNGKGLSVDVAMQPNEEGMGEHPVKPRKPYTITKQREKWTDEEHEKFLEALKLYGRSWRQIQEHIGTKTAVQIRSHAQKFFSKVVREPGAKIEIEIPPPRPKRKPLHPYPRKRADSCNGANPANGPSKLAQISSSSGSDQENGSPVSVLSAMQSDAFGSSMSNPSSRSTSPESSDEENNVPPMVSREEGQRTGINQSHKEADQENKDTGTSEEDSSDEVQVTSVKLFGKTVVIPDPRKSHPGGLSVLPHNEATDESEAAKSPLVESSSKSPPVESSSDSDDNAETTANKEWKVLESLGMAQLLNIPMFAATVG